MRLLLAFILCLPLLFWGGVRIYKAVELEANVTGHLKRAADANTVETALREMEKVVAEIERRGLVTGYTSILYRTPDEDIEFWYNNLKEATAELRHVKPDATQLERSNVLMKLRETLLDSGSVTVPLGISVYPSNSGYAWCGGLSLLALVVAFWQVAVAIEEY